MRGRRTSFPEALLAGPFTVDEARRHGVMLDRLRDRRQFRRLLHGVYVACELPLTRQLWIEAAAKVLPLSAVFSHRTAARIWGIPVADHDLIHVTVTRSTTCPRFRRIRVHQTNEDLPWVYVDGQRVTPPERTFVDLAAELGLVDLVVAGDRMLRDQLIDRSALERQVESANRRRGARMARSAVELLRPRVASSAETRLRLLLVLSGLPEPLVNTDVVLLGGALRFTPALHYPRARIALEPERLPWVDLGLLGRPERADSARLTDSADGAHGTDGSFGAGFATTAATAAALAAGTASGDSTGPTDAVAPLPNIDTPAGADDCQVWWQDRDLVRRINDRGWQVSTCDTTDLWRTGWATVQELHSSLRARHQPGTPSAISRTRVQSAIETLMDASEVAWTRVPRRPADAELVTTADHRSPSRS